MTTEEAMDYIRCALDAGCTQIYNDKYRGQCTDEQMSEAIETISKDLEELETYREICSVEELSEIELYFMV